ncbi:PREDICTED: uncharacterized protein LOC106302126 [Brassica oleracea var. oleracea]|uniref:uncharacterized protein LOC106302126 n=1 Tax=Brassica oleracea var. oleracea TaxID=109376 RepID=UPI0006A6F91E|nr:PREDICTED: uncharacterized protein LOC106302126 [Brassica oleracea var. oleracea]
MDRKKSRTKGKVSLNSRINRKQKMKRIPRIKFPQRHSSSSSPSTSSGSGPAHGSVAGGKRNVTASSDVPAAPKNIADGGKASLQPKRTPVSDKEIESIMLGGCI